jgi:hypothetical protein
VPLAFQFRLQLVVSFHPLPLSMAAFRLLLPTSRMQIGMDPVSLPRRAIPPSSSRAQRNGRGAFPSRPRSGRPPAVRRSLTPLRTLRRLRTARGVALSWTSQRPEAGPRDGTGLGRRVRRRSGEGHVERSGGLGRSGPDKLPWMSMGLATNDGDGFRFPTNCPATESMMPFSTCPDPGLFLKGRGMCSPPLGIPIDLGGKAKRGNDNEKRKTGTKTGNWTKK